MHIENVEPTCFFVKRKNQLLQAAEITIRNTEGIMKATILAILRSKKRQIATKRIEEGKRKYRIYIPEIKDKIQIEFILKAKGKIHDRKKMSWMPQRHWEIYLVPIAHHDLGYTDTIERILYRYEEFYDDIIRFFEETVDFPEESKFRYTIEVTWSIQHYIKKRSKKIIDKLSKYIKQGRIEIPAFYGNEISALCGHEELIRLMYPSFHLKREFGTSIQTASITDIHGLSWGLPTVLSGAGVKFFFAGLPIYNENDIQVWNESEILRHGKPDAFRWQAPNSDSILVYYQGHYGCWTPPSYKEALNKLPQMLKELEDIGCPFSVLRYGWGCGDNTPPDIKVSHIAREWNKNWAFPKIIVATNAMFFRELEKQCKDLRVFRGELPHTDCAVGATSTAKETGINRITRDRLYVAEKLATIASLVTDYNYPADDIREAYENMMLYNEHTWGMARQIGEKQDWSWNEKSHYAYKASGLAQDVLSKTTQIFADLVKLDEKGYHIMVINSLSFKRTDIVRMPVRNFFMTKHYEDYNQRRTFINDLIGNGILKIKYKLIDEATGELIPYQIVKINNPHAPTPYSAHRYSRGQSDTYELYDLVFIAENVPPLGYKTYRLLPREEEKTYSSSIIVDDASLENRFYKITLNPKSGTIESIYDKKLLREIVDCESPHTMNQFIARRVKTGEEETEKKVRIRKGEDGPVYGSLTVTGEGPGCPKITQEIIIYDKIKRIDFANRILKDSTTLHEIYYAFPFLVKNPRFHYEGSNSVIEPLVDQFPGSNTNYYAVQHWANVTDGEINITLSPIESHLFEFGGLWASRVSPVVHGVTPRYFERGFSKTKKLKNGYIHSYIINNNFRTNFLLVQNGDLLFRYSLTTYEYNTKMRRSRDFGWSVGNPLISHCMYGKKEGVLTNSMSFFNLSEPNILLLTLKLAEDGDGVICRLIETEGIDCNTKIRMPFTDISKVYKTNLVEENKKVVSSKNRTITVPIKAFDVTTIRIQTKKAKSM
jgi:hypothetical protein